MKKYVCAIDQGTTSTRFVIFNKNGEIIAISQKEHKQIFPKPGWVEHDPMEIKANTIAVIENNLKNTQITSEELAAIGITNQRETTIVWNRETGKPYYNAIVWQDTRTANICKQLQAGGNIDCYREKVGLPLSTYFSGPKVKWILDNIEGVRKDAEKNTALFGNIDTWIIWWLTGGPKGGLHITDVTNASRTMLMNINTLKWDTDMLNALDIPPGMLPEIRSSSEVYAQVSKDISAIKLVPICGDLGDQQSALFGQTCFEPGEAKNTYGTGCFLLLNTGEKPVQSKQGLITTLGYKIGENKPVYALEGSVAIAGSLVQWFRDNIGLIDTSKEIEELARSVDDNGGIYFVPAFTGLFAPYWRSDARGVIVGLTHYIGKGHLARAVLEATAFQTQDVFKAMEKDSGIKLKALKIDGGMVKNELLMQFQADLLGIPVIRPKITETTVLGAAYAAGLAVNFWKDLKELKQNWNAEKKWISKMDLKNRKRLIESWKKAIEKSLGWMY